MISWKSIFTVSEEMFGQVGAVEARPPCRDRRRSCCSSRAVRSAFPTPAVERACRARRRCRLRRRSECSLSLIMLMTVQGTTPKILFHRGPALNGADGHLGRCHPAIDHDAELGHLHQGGARDCRLRRHIFLDRGQFRLHAASSSSFMRSMRPRISERSSVSTEMPVRFEHLLAVADRVEGRRAARRSRRCAVAETPYHTADCRKPSQVLGNSARIGVLGVQCGEGVRDAVLAEVVAGGHLAAEAVAAEVDGHLRGIVWRGLDQHRHTQIGQAQASRQSPVLRRSSAA